MIVGDTYGVQTIIRGEDEEYIDDTVEPESENDSRIMFWGCIVYGKPARECPIVVYEKESTADKKTASDYITQYNADAMVRVMDEREIFYAEEKERRKLIPVGQKPRGQPKLPDHLKKDNVVKVRGRKGGIDWYR